MNYTETFRKHFGNQLNPTIHNSKYKQFVKELDQEALEFMCNLQDYREINKANDVPLVWIAKDEEKDEYVAYHFTKEFVELETEEGTIWRPQFEYEGRKFAMNLVAFKEYPAERLPR